MKIKLTLVVIEFDKEKLSKIQLLLFASINRFNYENGALGWIYINIVITWYSISNQESEQTNSTNSISWEHQI